MTMPPLKPQVCIIGDRIAVFIGADYKHLDYDAAKNFVRAMQGEVVRLRRQLKKKRRASR